MAALEQQETNQLLRETVRYLREIASFNRREDLLQALPDKDQRAAYDASDGTRTAEQVREAADVSAAPRTVRRWWERWVEHGIADRLSDGKVRNRYDVAVLPTLATDGE